MTIYTFSEARQNFASILEKAKVKGKVLIKRKDGTIFMLQPVPKKDSPLDVEGIDIGINAFEIVSMIRETRER